MRSTLVSHAPSRRSAVVLASILLVLSVAIATLVIVPPAIGQAPPPAVPWVDLYGPSGAPDRVTLNPAADPATSQTVTWRTSTDVTTPVAQIAPIAESGVFKNYDGRSGRNDVTSVPATTSGDISETLQYPMRFHTATFTGLEPDTTYLYRVGDGNTSGRSSTTGLHGARANWSEWFEFTTASAEAEDFSFIYYGDAQNMVKEHASRVFRKAFAQRPDAEMVVHAGDLVDYGNRDYEFGEWFHASGFTTGQINQFATPGNHEYSWDMGSTSGLSPYWGTQFRYPTNGPKAPEGTPDPLVYERMAESVFYVDYQGVRFISLDSNSNAVPSAQRQAWFDIQAQWLDQVLESNPHRWSVLTFHHPVFSVSSGRNNAQLRTAWLPVIEAHNVDLVLQGHDHTYGRGNVLDNRMVNSDLHNGTVYAVSVSGPKMYDVSGQVWRDNGAELRSTAGDTQLYQLIDVSADEIRYEAYDATGAWHDGFVIDKDEAGDKVVRDLDENGVEYSTFRHARAELDSLADEGGITDGLEAKVRQNLDTAEAFLDNPRQRGPALAALDRASSLLLRQAELIERGATDQGDAEGLRALAAVIQQLRTTL